MKKIINILLKNLILLCIFGCLYSNIELLWRNKTDVRMILVGGICGVLIGLINEIQPKISLFFQSLISTAIVLIVEFLFGYYFNIIQGLNIWDYSDLPFNLMGQICLPYAILWLFLSIICIYVDDLLRYKLFGKEKPESFINYIKKLFIKKEI